MYKKMSAARKRAFLEGLAQTGNQTLAAERAKVSRSWVCLHRKQDPAFDAEVRAAIDEARRAFGKAGRCEPPVGWGFLDGEELVVRGSGGGRGRGCGSRIQVARARIGQWTARTEDRFLATLAATGNVKAACSEVGKSAASAYEHAKRWSGFEAKWEAAIRESEVRLGFAVIENLGNPASSPELPPAAEVPRMTTDDAMHGLYMNKRKLTGGGGRRGRLGRPPAIEAVTEKIVRACDTLKRARALPPGVIAADREEWRARRRRLGRGGGGASEG